MELLLDFLGLGLVLGGPELGLLQVFDAEFLAKVIDADVLPAKLDDLVGVGIEVGSDGFLGN